MLGMRAIFPKIGPAIAVVALVLSLGLPRETMAGEPRTGAAVNTASADIGRIVGNPVEIRAEPEIAHDPALAKICHEVIEGFRDASAEPGLHDRLSHVVHEIVLARWTLGEAPRQVALHKGVLTVQTLLDGKGIDHLRPVVTQVLKEKVEMMEKFNRQATL